MKDLFIHLGLKFIRQESGKNGPELIYECPWCGSKKFSVNGITGAWQCWKGCGEGHPYQIAKKLTNLDAKEIFKLLKRFGIDQGSPSNTKSKPKPKPKPTTPKITPEEMELLSKADAETFCKAKGVDREALMKLQPYKHKTKPWVLIPAYNPADPTKPCGWIRAGIDGQLIPIRYREGGTWKEKFEKYPVIAGSSPGLVGFHALDKDSDTIIYTEGFKDVLAALLYGYNAICNSQGAKTWRDSWLKVFKGKKVHVIFDRDKTGVEAAQKIAAKIYEVAESVKVIDLPYKVIPKGGKDLFDYLSGVRE